jgi:hypothetical protein
MSFYGSLTVKVLSADAFAHHAASGFVFVQWLVDRS